MPLSNDYNEFFDKYSPDRKAQNQQSIPPKKPKRRAKNIIKLLLAIIALGIVAVIIFLTIKGCSKSRSTENNQSTTSSVSSNTTEHIPTVNTNPFPEVTEKTVTLSNEIESKYAVLVDVSNNVCLATKGADKKIYPASLTKIMTLLVAAENVDDTTATFKMTSKIIDPLYKENAAMAGFMPGEEVKIIDMFYGSILTSGAEATVGLAVYISGSEEAFVELMNQKAEELGLTNTRFTNTTGLHDKNHYTTCNEMAIILATAMKNDFCKKLLTTEYYTVAKNNYHGELKFHSTTLSRMYGTEPEVATILGGKTGFTSNSGNCLATLGITDDGRDIVCVTAAAEGTYKPIYDAIELYKNYTHPNEK